MTAEDFDEECKAAANWYIQEMKTLNKTWEDFLAALVHKAETSGIPSHMSASSINQIIKSIEEAAKSM